MADKGAILGLSQDIVSGGLALRLWSVRMTWLIVFLVICALIATFLRRYQRHLDVLTGPWIKD